MSTPSPAAAASGAPRRTGRRALIARAEPPPERAAGVPPDPEALLRDLAVCVVEILGGARDVEQLVRWVSEEVYRSLLTRALLARRRRQLSAAPAVRPAVRLGGMTVCEPAEGVLEGVVVVHSRARSRAVAIRLELLRGRWRAVAIHIL